MYSPDELAALAAVLDEAARLLAAGKYEPFLRPDYPRAPGLHSATTALAEAARGTGSHTLYETALERLEAMLWLLGTAPVKNFCSVQAWGQQASKADAIDLLHTTSVFLSSRAYTASLAATR